MTTELITFKLEDSFLKDIDTIVEKQGYQNRTEFIRTALREKVDDVKMKETMASIAHLKGSSKKHISEEEYERVREEAFNEVANELKQSPRA